ncbi:hypothetical protein ACWKWU_09600 [Chitinophaga lutea]
MKAKSLLTGLCLLAGATFTACEKKDIFADNKVEGYLSMKVNDSLITVTKQLTATLYDSTGNYLVVISGLTASNQLMTVNFVLPNKQFKAGEYKLTALDHNYISWMKKPPSIDNYSADDVSLGAAAVFNIESVSDSKAKGTFTGVMIHEVDADDKKTVTEGKFEVSPIIRLK